MLQIKENYEHLINKVNNVILIYQEKVYFVPNRGTIVWRKSIHERERGCLNFLKAGGHGLFGRIIFPTEHPEFFDLKSLW